MPGVIEIITGTSVKRVIDDLAEMIGAGTPADFENQVLYVPYRYGRP